MQEALAPRRAKQRNLLPRTHPLQRALRISLDKTLQPGPFAHGLTADALANLRHPSAGSDGAL